MTQRHMKDHKYLHPCSPSGVAKRYKRSRPLSAARRKQYSVTMKLFFVVELSCALCVAVLGKPTLITDTGDRIDGQFIVVFSAVDERMFGNVVASQSRRKGGKTIALVEADDAMRAELERNPAVESIEVNRKISLIKPVQTRVPAEQLQEKEDTRLQSTSDAGTCYQRLSFAEDYAWGSIRTSYRQLPDYFFDPYYVMYRGAGVDVYVLDTGVDINHMEFSSGRASHGVVSPSFDNEGPTDFNGHGTHVAGTVAGNVLGLADQSNIISCKALDANGTGTYYDAIYGINWVIQQVQDQKTQGLKPRAIINMSLGGPSYSTAFYQAIQAAVDEGISVVVAAGNDAEDAGDHYPAAYNNTITVAATNKSDDMADFSNYGVSVAIAAPGVEIAAAGSSNISICASLPAGACMIIYSGTSQAAPHVSGVVARHLSSLTDQEFDLQTHQSIQDTLQQTATQGRIVYKNQFQAETPNLLLYKECGKTSVGQSDTTTLHPVTTITTTAAPSTTTATTTLPQTTTSRNTTNTAPTSTIISATVSFFTGTTSNQLTSTTATTTWPKTTPVSSEATTMSCHHCNVLVIVCFAGHHFWGFLFKLT